MKTKKTVLFILCAVLAVSVSAFPVRFEAAEAAVVDTRNVFQYDTYETGDYYEINYYLDIYEDTADEINRKCGDVDVPGSEGIYKLFNSIENFFYAYEALFFDVTSGARFRRASVEAHGANNPFYSFNMYIVFESDDNMKASKKYNKYFGYDDSDDELEPTTKGFFADKYEMQSVTHFFVPSGLPDYNGFGSGNLYNYEAFQELAILNAVAMPFLFYGSDIKLLDTSVRSINYKGLVNIFKDYFSAKEITSRGIFSNYVLYHSMSASTTYIKTDADYKSASMGEYMHVWEVSYTDPDYSPNRIINITYIEPKIINMYFFAMIIAVFFIALLLLCFYGLPKLMKKEKTQ